MAPQRSRPPPRRLRPLLLPIDFLVDAPEVTQDNLAAPPTDLVLVVNIYLHAWRITLTDVVRLPNVTLFHFDLLNIL